jgi:Ser/Thr protein kinase RdoA (MazF antagonist)
MRSIALSRKLCYTRLERDLGLFATVLNAPVTFEGCTYAILSVVSPKRISIRLNIPMRSSVRIFGEIDETMMNEQEQLTEAVKRVYDLQNIALTQRDLHLLQGRGVYEVSQGNGPRWVLRASCQEEDHASLLNCAAVLQWLQQHHYEAPVVLEGRGGIAVGVSQGWRMLMTTWIEGSQLDYTPKQVYALGMTLGRLHQVQPSIATTTMPSILHAWWRPLQVGQEALHRLLGVAEKVPPMSQAQYELCRRTLLHTSQWQHLPPVIVHGDCHPGNALQTPSGQVVLIDWEQAGIGPAVLDVGALLLRCHPLWLRPNADLIQAVVDGYGQYRFLTFPELDALYDAMCLKIALEGAWQIIDAVKRGEESDMKRLKKLYILAAEVALLARARFEQFL